MSNRDTQIPRATNVSRVEVSDRLLRRSRPNPSDARQTGRVETDAHERALLPTGDELEHNVSSCVYADLVIYKEWSSNFETTQVAPLASEQLLVRDDVVGISVQVGDFMKLWCERRLTSVKKVSMIAYLQPWKTWYFATWRRSWTPRCSLVIFLMPSLVTTRSSPGCCSHPVRITEACDLTSQDGQ